MGTTADNVAKLQDAFRQWHECKGASTRMWTDLFAPDIRFRSLAAGAPGMEFTVECRGLKDVEAYFAGLARDWEMVHYTTAPFAAEGDRVAMLGSTAWRHRQTQRVVDTPKADFVTFRDGRIVEFYEFYDTATVLATTRS